MIDMIEINFRQHLIDCYLLFKVDLIEKKNAKNISIIFISSMSQADFPYEEMAFGCIGCNLNSRK